MSDETVLLPYFAGEVYHSSNPVCSFMERGREELTRDEAEEKGYRPCKWCFNDE